MPLRVRPRTKAFVGSTRRTTRSPFAVRSGPAVDGSDYGRRKSAAYQAPSLAAAVRRACSGVLLRVEMDVQEGRSGRQFLVGSFQPLGPTRVIAAPYQPIDRNPARDITQTWDQGNQYQEQGEDHHREYHQ